MLTAAPIHFAPAHFYPLTTGQVKVGNFVNGGLPDLVGVDGTDNVVHILINTGDGAFRPGQTFYIPEARAAAVADFNHDGNEDIAVSTPTTTNNSASSTQTTIYIFHGNGDGTFQTPPRQVGVNFQITDIAAVDVNGDGYPDIIATVSHRVIVMINRGDGTFAPPVGYDAGAQFAGQLVIGDFNNDGVPDIAVTRTQSNEIAILLGQKNANGTPTGTFSKAELYHVGSNPRAIAVGDFNGDGKEDLAVANAAFREPSLWVFLGNGDGTFAKPQHYYGGNFVDGITTGDYNGDGLTDIATVSFTSFLRAYPGNGDGTFQPFTEFATSAYGQNVVSADFNGDGLTDIATATGGGIRVLLATRTTAPPPPSTSLDVTLGGGNPRSITWRDASGSTATITLGGPGSATVDFTGNNLSLSGNGSLLIGGTASATSITAAGTTSGTTLAINPQGINGVLSVGPISTDGSFRAIVAPRTNLVGNLTIPGTIGAINFDNMTDGTITLGSTGAAVNLTLRNAIDENLNSAQSIGSLSIGEWFSSSSAATTIAAPAIRSISASVQFFANLTIGPGGIKSVFVRNIPSGTWNVSGPIDSIYSGRNIGGTFNATTINSIVAMNNLNNLVVNTTGNIGAISAGSMANSSIYAGVGPLPAGQRLPETAGDFTSAAKIGSVTLRSRFAVSSFSNSSLAASTLGRLSLGVIVFANGGSTQGLAGQSIGFLTGFDQATKKAFSLAHPTSLNPLIARGISVGDFKLLVDR